MNDTVTELYFCPIRYAQKVATTHIYYERFFPYVDDDDYPQRLKKLRQEIVSDKRSLQIAGR